MPPDPYQEIGMEQPTPQRFVLPDGDYDPDPVPPNPPIGPRCKTCGVELDFSEEVYCSFCKGLMDD